MAVRFVTDFNSAVLDDFVLKHQRNGRDNATPLLEAIDRMISRVSDDDLAELREKYGPRALLDAAEKLAGHVGGALPEHAGVLEAEVARIALEAGAQLQLSGPQIQKAMRDNDRAMLDRHQILLHAAYPSRVEESGIDPKAWPANTHLSKVRDFKFTEPAEGSDQQHDAGAGGLPSLARR